MTVLSNMQCMSARLSKLIPCWRGHTPSVISEVAEEMKYLNLPTGTGGVMVGHTVNCGLYG